MAQTVANLAPSINPRPLGGRQAEYIALRSSYIQREEIQVSDEGYNGWKNYPTWAVHLWLDNDQGSQDAWIEVATEHLDAEHPRYEVSSRLKLWVREECESDDASMASDLLGYALDCVDWYEIADAYLEIAAENVTA